MLTYIVQYKFERHYISRKLHDFLKVAGVQINYPSMHGRNLEGARLVLVGRPPFSQFAVHDEAVDSTLSMALVMYSTADQYDPSRPEDPTVGMWSSLPSNK